MPAVAFTGMVSSLAASAAYARRGGGDPLPWSGLSLWHWLIVVVALIFLRKLNGRAR
jgi:hypothetical protein